jgi:hypothetical protein
MIEVPWAPRKRESRPAMTSAAIWPLPVGRPGQRHAAPLAGDDVPDLDGVADREDVRVGGPHVLVDADPPALADLEAGRLGEGRVRSHADGEDHEVGRVRCAGKGLDLDRPAGQLGEARRTVVENDADIVPLHMFLNEARNLRVQRSQKLRQLLDEGHLEPEVHQVLRRLEADETPANHHRTRRRPHVLDPGVLEHPGEELGSLLDPRADRPHVRSSLRR